MNYRFENHFDRERFKELRMNFFALKTRGLRRKVMGNGIVSMILAVVVIAMGFDESAAFVLIGWLSVSAWWMASSMMRLKKKKQTFTEKLKEELSFMIEHPVYTFYFTDDSWGVEGTKSPDDWRWDGDNKVKTYKGDLLIWYSNRSPEGILVPKECFGDEDFQKVKREIKAKISKTSAWF